MLLLRDYNTLSCSWLSTHTSSYTACWEGEASVPGHHYEQDVSGIPASTHPEGRLKPRAGDGHHPEPEKDRMSRAWRPLQRSLSGWCGQNCKAPPTLLPPLPLTFKRLNVRMCPVALSHETGPTRMQLLNRKHKTSPLWALGSLYLARSKVL